MEEQPQTQEPPIPPQPAQVIAPTTIAPTQQPAPQPQPSLPQFQQPAPNQAPLPQTSFDPSSTPGPAPTPKKSGKGLLIGLVLLVLLAAAAYWFVFKSDSAPAQSPAESSEDNSQTPTPQAEKQTWKPSQDLSGTIRLSHDDSWSEKYWLAKKGLIKDMNGQKYALVLTSNSLDYDYMDRTAGGAYPPGTLYKTVSTEQGKTVHVGTFEMSGGTYAFLSTCPITANGGCSLKETYSDGSNSLYLVELTRYLPEQDEKTYENLETEAIVPLQLGNTTDKEVLDEFVSMLSTLVF